MARTHLRAADLDGPALVEGALTYLRGVRYAERAVALCFLPYPGLLPVEMIDRQAREFDEIDTALLIVASGARPLHRLWAARGDKPRAPVLGDVGGRLHRALRVAIVEPALRCHTIVVDRTGVLRLRVSHDFVEHDLAVLRETIDAAHRFAADADSPRTGAACLPA